MNVPEDSTMGQRGRDDELVIISSPADYEATIQRLDAELSSTYSSLQDAIGRHLRGMADFERVVTESERGAADEFGRAILTLSTGTLVLSISLSKPGADVQHPLRLLGLLPLSWVLLGAAVVIGIGRIAQVKKTRDLGPELRVIATRARHVIAAAQRAGHPPEDGELDTLIDDGIRSAVENTVGAYERLKTFDRALWICFVSGIACLIAFGAANLPWSSIN